MKKLWQILVPTVRNDGRPFRLRYHRVWDSKVRELSGGLTVTPPVKGQWVDDDGTLYAERMIPVNILATDEEIERIVDMTIQYYEQIAVMYYLVSDQAFIKRKST